ncbi:MAG: 3-phosphoshikimate 1-carboxyvinyltransferase [Chloroflexota bacterium]
MSQIIARAGASLRGRIGVPGDKSISHRALLLGCLAHGRSEIHGFLPSADCMATLGCIRQLGIVVDRESNHTVTVHGRGLHGLQRPRGPLDCLRSGTTMRLLAGMLAGQSFDSVLTGDPQLLRRPMGRIAEPLRRMEIHVDTTDGHGPLTIHGGSVRGCEHRLPVASAQVKSAILLAGLYAPDPTVVHQPGPARDHTERMLAAMGADIKVAGLTVTLTPRPSPLHPFDFAIPGDISSASFPLVAALLLPGSRVTLERVGVNPTRTGLLHVLQAMGAQIAIDSRRQDGGEPAADVTARSSSLRGVGVSGNTVVRMIDEFPLLAVAATQARGTTLVRDAAELRVKETDRIAVIAVELSKMGAQIEPRRDGFAVAGPTPLLGAAVDSHGDHRIAMALAVAGLLAEGETIIYGADCTADSFPGFVETMQQIGAQMD